MEERIGSGDTCRVEVGVWRNMVPRIFVMRKIIFFFILANWLCALASIPGIAVSNGVLEMQVMGRYSLLRNNNAINTDRLNRVGWEKLTGTELQKASEFFLGDAPHFYFLVACFSTALFAANGIIQC